MPADGQGGHRGRGRRGEEKDGGGAGCFRGLPKKQELLLPPILARIPEQRV